MQLRRKTEEQKTLRSLPAPRRIDLTLTETIKARHSSHEFSDDPIDDKDLSTVLWATDGLIDKSGHRATPTLMNHHCVSVYVVKSNGIWLWNPTERALEFINDIDCRKEISLSQAWISNAPVHFVYVANPLETRRSVRDYISGIFKMKPSETDIQVHEMLTTHGPILDTGAKVQACYMACAALQMNCLVRLSFDAKKVRKALKLTPSQLPIAIQTIGYEPRNIFNIAH